MTRAALLLLACLCLLLAACTPTQVQPAAPPAEIPQPQSEVFERFLWQEDGSYAYAMLRPAHWKTLENGSRTYLPPGITDPAAFSLMAVNLHVLTKNGMDAFSIEPLELFQLNPNLAGWTRALERAWEQTGALANIEPIQTLDQAKVYAIHGQGGYLRLTAYTVDQGQPLLVVLDLQGDLADLDRLREEGILDDYLTVVNSIRAIPYQPAFANPALLD